MPSDVEISIGADASLFQSGMAAIRNEVNATGKAVTSSLGSLFSPAGLIGGFLVGGFKELIDKARQIHHESERFSVDAESLQRIGNAAKEDGISLEATARTLNLLTINAQAALNPTSKQAEALKELGINATEFASLKPDEQFMKLADAYSATAKTGADYANVALLIGKRNTELIPILAKGSAAIKEQGNTMGVWTDAAVKNLASVSKGFEIGSNQLQAMAANSIAWLQKWEDKIEATAQKIHNFLFNTPGQGFPPTLQPGGGGFGGKGAGSSFGPDPNPALREELDITKDLEAEDEKRWNIAQLQNDLDDKRNANWTATLSLDAKLAELDAERAAIRAKLIELETEGTLDDEKKLELQNQIEAITSDILPLEKQIADEKSRAADEAERQAAADAKDAAIEAEKLAKQQADREQRTADQIRNAAGALAQNNLRLGATSDVYAAALAASRGLQPGSPAYNQLVQQITAQDQLRSLQGGTLGWEEQLNRDKLVQWYGNQQQNTTNQNAASSLQQQIAYWQALASGHAPPAGNPYTSLFGNGGLQSGLVPGGSLLDTNSLLAQIIALLTPRPGGI